MLTIRQIRAQQQLQRGQQVGQRATSHRQRQHQLHTALSNSLTYPAIIKGHAHIREGKHDKQMQLHIDSTMSTEGCEAHTSRVECSSANVLFDNV